MDSSSEHSQIPSVEVSHPDVIPNDDDKHFLLYFVTAVYFGPHLKTKIETSVKSVLQRRSENLPPYKPEELAGSHMKIIEMERVYSYVLRKVDNSLMERSILDQFYQGKLPTHYPQFPDLFPPEFHFRSFFQDEYRIVHNILFIHNPDISHLNPEELERFMRLTGLDNVVLDIQEARRLHILSNLSISIKELPPITEEDEDAEDDVQLAESSSSVPYGDSVETQTKSDEQREPEFPLHKAYAMTGTAAFAPFGPVIGLVDVGESEDSYYFCMSLPGVKNGDDEYNCTIDSNGRVLIEGVTTTGEKTVLKFSQEFEMLTQNMCPPGQFSITFDLPGPVNEERFIINFGTDGILEGAVMKDLEETCIFEGSESKDLEEKE